MTLPENLPGGSGLWVPPEACDHPREAIKHGAMSFVDAEIAVVDTHCLKCLGHWTDPNTMPYRVFAVLMRDIAEGRWTAFSAYDPEIDGRAKFQLTRYRTDILEMLGNDGL